MNDISQIDFDARPMLALLDDSLTDYPARPRDFLLMKRALSGLLGGIGFIVASGSFADSSNAAVYHVAPDSGDDAADGLGPATAWRSVVPLGDRELRPGDGLRFKAGTVHRGAVDLAARGAAGNPVIVGRYGDGPAPVIDGSGESAAMIVRNPDHLIVEDLEITNRADTVTARNGLEIRASDGTTAEEITLRRLHIHHVSGHDDRNGGCGILAGAGRSTDGRASRYDGLRIEDCLLHDLPFNGILVSGWETRGRDARGELENPSTRVHIHGNLLHDIAGDAICIITSRGAVIEHNEVYRSSLGQVRGKPEAASAAIWPHSSDGTIMRFNRVEGLRGEKDGQAFDVDYDCRDTLIDHNFTRDNGTGFLLVCAGMEQGKDLGTTRVTVSNNLCLDECAEPPGGLFTLVSRVRDILIENNAFLFSEVGQRRFLRAGNWLSPDWPQNVRFQKNVIVTAGVLFNETGESGDIRYSGNLVVGEVRFPAVENTKVLAAEDLLGPLSSSFTETVRRHPAITGIGFKPFDPSLAGLPRGSRLAECARKARGMSQPQPAR